MANTFVFSRSHIIYAACLPLAIILGYLLAEPLDSGTQALVTLLLAVLSVPLLMRWHHPLLIFSCNAVVMLNFLPGRPSLWMLMTALSLLFSVLNRSMGRELNFFHSRQVSLSLFFLAIVVLVTAKISGGFGIAALGSSNFGGKKYVTLLASIAMYFALTTTHIRRERAGLYVALFFLSALTSLVGFVAAFGGPSFYFLVALFPIESTLMDTVSSFDLMAPQVTRLGELVAVAISVCCILLARYGMRGVLDLKKPWRLVLMGAAVVAALATGFRSNLALLIMICLAMFYVEGLFRSRYLVPVILAALVAVGIMLPNVQHLPLGMQRTLSFLPINVDPIARDSAEGSTKWRTDMWKLLLPDVPKYLIVGKGYSLNPEDLYQMSVAAKQGFVQGDELSMIAGDYHSGPLSVIVAFGIFGVIGFVWFLVAATRVLRQNYLYGDPSLRNINMFLYAYFIVRIINFIFIFGSLYSDLGVFVALVGFGISLNGGVCKRPEPQPENIEDEEAYLPQFS